MAKKIKADTINVPADGEPTQEESSIAVQFFSGLGKIVLSVWSKKGTTELHLDKDAAESLKRQIAKEKKKA
jgi:hypothetical protein